MTAFKQPDLRNRSPKVEILSDLRQRVTRVYDILNEVTKAQTAAGVQPGVSAYALPWGTVDAPPASQGPGYPNCLLIKQFFSGDFDASGDDPEHPQAKKPTLTRIYEQIPATAEIQVGQPDTTVDQDGLTELTVHSIQFSAAAGGVSVFGTVGSSSTTAPNGVGVVLKEEVRTDDGTLQRIDRHYISAGLVSEDTVLKYDGALTLLTQTWVNDPQSPPAGYTLIDTKIEHPGGLNVETYTWAKGTGQISLQVEYRLSPDQGTTGVTVQTIKFLSVPGASNPITPPGGYEEIAITFEEQDGYRLWTGIYAFGQGIISTEIEYRFLQSTGGAPNTAGLVLTTITSINSAPSAPAPVVSGTVVLIKSEKRNGTRFEDGTIIYTYTFAEAAGGASGQEISSDVEYIESIDTGTNGVTRTTLKYIVSPGATVQPTSLSGSVLVKQEFTDAEGYRIWTTVWGKGAGIVLTETNISESGALVTYRTVALGTAPSAPSSTIGGTVTLFESELKIENGYKVYDYRWSEGNGQESIVTRGESDGSILYEVTTNTATASTPAYPGGGSNSLVDLQQTQRAGYVVNRATYRKWPASTALRRQRKFLMPGQIELTSPNPGWTFVPPVEMDILATETIDYNTTQVTTTPFTVSAWSSLNYSYTTVAPSGGSAQTVAGEIGANKYLSGSTGGSGGSATFNGISVSAYAYTITASTPSAPPSGSTTIEVQNEIYLVDTSGNIVYRRRVTTYTF